MTQKSKGMKNGLKSGHSDKKHLPADAQLWEQVKKTVTPIKTAKKASATAKPDTKAKATAPTAPARAIPAPRTATPKTILPTNLERSAARRITRGDDAIDARLDLHGMTQAEAHKKLVSFVLRAQAKGFRTLLVITGKGRLSEGGGVLKRQLPLWLEGGELSSAVLSYAHAHIKDGGSGAFYLRLRKSRK